MKNTKETTRLSLEDFKMKKIESKKEIDKMMGQAAADCHYWVTPIGGGKGKMDE